MFSRRILRVFTLQKHYIISDSISNPCLPGAYSSFSGDNGDGDGDGGSSWPRHRRLATGPTKSDENVDAGRRPQQPRFYPNERPPYRQEMFPGRRQFDDEGGRRYGISDKPNSHNDSTNNNSTPHYKSTRVDKTNGNANLSPFDNEKGYPRNPENRQQQPLSHLNDDDGFLEKFKLGFDQGNSYDNKKTSPLHSSESVPETKATLPPPPMQDANEIFKRMKETGLIPNAVAMLHGLCNDGLVQEAMKLFGLMREKGTIPEVVIYTAVVEGFCKAQQLEDAKRIFRKMQNNGITANAFSYSVLIQGLYACKSLDDALEFCLEMLEAGHLPNLTTFTGLVDGFCRERGLEAAEAMVGTLRRKGLFVDDRAVKEFMEKKGPFLPSVWEAIFGKKRNSKKSFLSHPKQA